MFDWVDIELPCPLCGTIAKGFQTKNGACFLETISPDKAGNFYSTCDNSKCSAWIECSYIPPQGTGVIEATATIREWDDIEKRYKEPSQQKSSNTDWNPDASKKDNDKK